jgi:hypothetical protein
MGDRPQLNREDPTQALQSLKAFGFNALPYEITVTSDMDEDDAA